jgi:hypothetical protein
MPISFLTTALLIVSVITNLTVEGIKKLLDGTKVKYSSKAIPHRKKCQIPPSVI